MSIKVVKGRKYGDELVTETGDRVYLEGEERIKALPSPQLLPPLKYYVLFNQKIHCSILAPS